MKYFAVDYRSPPSGMGQICNTDLDSDGIDKILISYPGCGLKNDPNYHRTIHLTHPDIEKSDWIGPIIPLLHQTLKSHGVTKVYDTEEGYNRPDQCDEYHFFDLDSWINILKSYV